MLGQPLMRLMPGRFHDSQCGSVKRFGERGDDAA